LQIENYLECLVKGENTKKDNSKVALAQDKSAHDVGHIQSINQFSVFFESGNQFFGTEPTGAKRKINCDGQKDNNGHKPNRAFRPPAEKGKNRAYSNQVNHARNNNTQILPAPLKVANERGYEVSKGKKVGHPEYTDLLF